MSSWLKSDVDMVEAESSLRRLENGKCEGRETGVGQQLCWLLCWLRGGRGHNGADQGAAEKSETISETSKLRCAFIAAFLRQPWPERWSSSP